MDDCGKNFNWMSWLRLFDRAVIQTQLLNRVREGQQTDNDVIQIKALANTDTTLILISSKMKVKPWFFVTFNIIINHIFPEKFIEIPQVVQKI